MVHWIPLATVPRPLGQQNTLKSFFSGPNRGITGSKSVPSQKKMRLYVHVVLDLDGADFPMSLVQELMRVAHRFGTQITSVSTRGRTPIKIEGEDIT